MLLDCWKNIRECFEHLDSELFGMKANKLNTLKITKKKDDKKKKKK